MEEYKFLLDIAIILAMTKAFSLVSKKFNMPPVVGALIAGIILGPVVLNIVDPSDSILNFLNACCKSFVSVLITCCPDTSK